MSRALLAGILLLTSGIASAGKLEIVNDAATVGQNGLRVTAGVMCTIDNVTVTGPTVSTDQMACQTLSTSGAVEVSGTVRFTAGDVISLGPGFRVPQDATFRADVNGFVASPYAYVRDDSPDAETTYNARFDLDADALNLVVGEDIEHFVGLSQDDTVQFELILRDTGSGKTLVLAARSGGTLIEHPTPLALEAAFNSVLLQWATGAGNGRFEVSLNGGAAESMNSLSNDTSRIDAVKWGLIDGPAVVTSDGAIDLDDFISFR